MAQLPKISVTSHGNNEHISVLSNGKLDHYYDENNNVIPAIAQPSSRLNDWQPIIRDENKQFRYKSSVTSTITNGSTETEISESVRPIGLPRKRKTTDCKTKFIRILFVSSLICTALFLVFYPLITYYIEEAKHNETESESDALGVMYFS